MTEMNGHLDEGTIHAWLDGALAPDESTRVEAHAQGCADCSALVAEARGLIAASSRILASLDAVPSGVIPGTDRGADQLAELRARKQATSRRWWSDRRVLAAASLLFVAGTFSVVWRQSASQPELAEIRSAAVPAPDSASPPAVVQREAAPPSVTDAVSSAKAEAPVPAPPLPTRVAANRAADSSVESKVAAIGAAAGRGASGAMNELARRSDVGTTRQEQVQAPAQVQAAQFRVDSLQRQQAAKQVTFQGLRTDTSRVTAAEPAAERRARSLAAAPAAAVAPRLSDVSSMAGCYVLRRVDGRSAAGIDSVKLLDEILPVLSGPSWFRAVRLGATPGTFSVAWRPVDSVTVELRELIDSGFALVRFTTTGALPDVRAIRDVRAAVAMRCREE